MSMTREEAIKAFEEIRENAQNNLGAKWAYGCDGYYRDKIELADVALAALRPVSRDQVEKAWRGECDCSNPKACCTCCSMRCQYCIGQSEYKQATFCMKCGRPLTDEAVEMVMERMEKIK